ncbi:hypothetical protein RDI58_001219 [Solanum bulbocastanum]|uniref:Receptor ligand binding region domain-containing protein n=1 Tax=Solanum bulbocastanum TaxID=147425 RepID=A0AAN8UBH2_SOLBU
MAKGIGMMSEGFVWIVTDEMADQLNLMDVSVIESMEGVIGVKPNVPKSKKVEDFIQRWKMKFLEENSRIVDVLGDTNKWKETENWSSSEGWLHRVCESYKSLTTNTTIVTGYCINVFDAVMEALPYYVPYEYVPFAAPDGKSAGDYNELVYQVFFGVNFSDSSNIDF